MPVIIGATIPSANVIELRLHTAVRVLKRCVIPIVVTMTWCNVRNDAGVATDGYDARRIVSTVVQVAGVACTTEHPS